LVLLSCSVLAIAAGSTPKILVHAGAGIRPPLDEIGALFQKQTGIRVDFNYKGSGCLLVDIGMSKKGDVYIPGETFYMDQARQKKLVADSRVVAGMQTVIIVQKGNPKGIARAQDLARPGLRIGLGDFEAVAAGRAAKEVLQKAGVLDAVVKNRVMSALNVIELGNGVKLNHLDAAIVWDATAALYENGEVTTIPIERNIAVVSPVPAAVLLCSQHQQAARRFVDFLGSDAAARIFVKHGYSVPRQGRKAGRR
jgi:molybdate transport system substrate-binding protein